MYRISSQTEKKIIEFWFKGIPRDKIARRMHVSGSTVSNIVNQLPECLKELRALSVELRKSNASLPETLKGAKLNSKLLNLNVTLDQLQTFIQAAEKSARNADYEPQMLVQAAMKLTNLEKETGKTYSEAIEHFEETIKETEILEDKKDNLETQTRKIKKEYNNYLKKTVKLNVMSQEAQTVLDTLDKTKRELAAYEIETDDLRTLKVFLNEIQRLKGDPAKAVKILKENESLEAKNLALQNEISEKKDGLQVLKQSNEMEKQDHLTKIRELEQKIVHLNEEIINTEERLNKLRKEESEQIEKNKGLRKYADAVGQSIDGLLRKQAEQLGVQADIDMISEAIPARKKELEKLNQEITEKKTLIGAAEAITALLAKKPYDRNGLIRWLQLTKNDAKYSSFDELTRQKIVDLMAQQGFVPIELLDAVKKKAEKEISIKENEIERRKRIDNRRLEELNECKEQLKKEREAKAKKRDESTDKRLANIGVELVKRLQKARE